MFEGPDDQGRQEQPEFEGPDDQEHRDQPEYEGPDDQELRDQPEYEGPDDQEHREQPEFEGPDDQELEDKREIPGGPGGSSGGGSPIQLHPPLFPAEASIPHYSDLKLFTAAKIYPWDPVIVGTVPIIAMIQATLTKWMPIPPPISCFPTESLLFGVDHRPPLRRIAVGYAALEEDHMITYWESTHYLQITTAMANADPDLFAYHADRRQRRIRAGESWRKLLGDVVLMMRAKWVDIDILLDPYFLHLPTKQDRVRWYPGSVSRAANLGQPTANLPEPIDLITALFECDQADPWRNHFRDPISAHPSLQIPRLMNKFNPPAAP
ncbi:hypothetical protein PHMEG_00028212 [Phytophthora megakarya]|uniref:Uncharacterized protein n=1 Tax=Phytophthora megakarya TaxID=4795 RepID=A0A225V5F7_9STRA|nr:hypothetical protein PHMEG_00028212 [Phytophthora megakarya]